MHFNCSFLVHRWILSTVRRAEKEWLMCHLDRTNFFLVTYFNRAMESHISHSLNFSTIFTVWYFLYYSNSSSFIATFFAYSFSFFDLWLNKSWVFTRLLNPFSSSLISLWYFLLSLSILEYLLQLEYLHTFQELTDSKHLHSFHPLRM